MLKCLYFYTKKWCQWQWPTTIGYGYEYKELPISYSMSIFNICVTARDGNTDNSFEIADFFNYNLSSIQVAKGSIDAYYNGELCVFSLGIWIFIPVVWPIYTYSTEIYNNYFSYKFFFKLLCNVSRPIQGRFS